VSVRQSRTVASVDFEARRRPSQENATRKTLSVWPSRLPRSRPVLGSKRRIISLLAKASVCPSGDQAIFVVDTVDPPLRVVISCKVFVFHRSMLSDWGATVARISPPGDQAILIGEA